MPPRHRSRPNVQAKPFLPGNQNVFFTNNQQVSRPYVPPPTLQPNTVQPTDTVNAQVCYYHQTFGDKARLCSEPCSYYKKIGQCEVAIIASYPAKLLYVDDIAFIESKQILASATLLVHPDPSAQLNIRCDASDFAVQYNST